MSADDFHDTERELLTRCLSGKAGDWAAFARRYRPLLYGSLRDALRRFAVPADPAVLEDLLQETFLSLLRQDMALLRRFRWDCSLGHYLVSIALHRCVDWLRQTRRHLLPDNSERIRALYKELLAEPYASPARGLETLERADFLEAAMTKLPRRDRLALHLFYWQALPVQAIARMLHLTPDSVWPHLARARQRLREILGSSRFLL